MSKSKQKPFDIVGYLSMGQRMAEAIARREARTGKRHVYANELRGANGAQLNSKKVRP